MKVNYINQLLINIGSHAGEVYQISIKKIKMNYQKWKQNLITDHKYKDEVKTEEELARLKLAYLYVMTAIKEQNNGKLVDENIEFDKRDIRTIAEEMSKRAQREYLKLKEEKSKNSRKHNEYSDLFITPRADIDEVRKRYLKLLRDCSIQLETQIQREDFDPIKNVKMEIIFLTEKQAFSNLSDPEYKMKLDEILLFNFSPNQEEKYIPQNVAEVTYLPEKPAQKTNPITGEQYETIPMLKFGDIGTEDHTEIFITQIGNIGYGRFRNSNGKTTMSSSRELKDYRVIKRYKDPALAAKRKTATQKEGALSIWDEEIDGEVFRISGDLYENILCNPEVDPNFIRYTKEVLLSNTNLEEAIEHNGGYIGSVAVNQVNGEYTVVHNRDCLCIAKEFQKILKTVPLEGNIAIYKLDQGTLEVYHQNYTSGTYRKEILKINNKKTPNKKQFEGR